MIPVVGVSVARLELGGLSKFVGPLATEADSTFVAA